MIFKLFEKFRLVLLLLIFFLPCRSIFAYYPSHPKKEGMNYYLKAGVDPGSFKRFDVLNPEKSPDLLMKMNPNAKISPEIIKAVIGKMNREEKESASQSIKEDLENKGYIEDPKHPDFTVAFFFWNKNKDSLFLDAFFNGMANPATDPTANASRLYLMILIFDVRSKPIGLENKQQVYSNVVTKGDYNPELKDWAPILVPKGLLGWKPKNWKPKLGARLN